MIFLLIPTAVFFLDYFVKSYIEKHKSPKKEEKKLGGRVVITRMSNYGTAGGKLEHRPGLVCLMNGIALLFMGAGYIWLLFQKGQYGLKMACGFLIGGGASNLFDRRKKGYVTDYIKFPTAVKPIRRLVFNISDFFIFAGSILGVIFGMISEFDK